MVNDPHSAPGLPNSVSNPRVVRGDDGRYYAVVYTDNRTGSLYGDLLPDYHPPSHSHRHDRHIRAGVHGRHHHGHAMRVRQTPVMAAPVLLHHSGRVPAEDPDEARIRALAIGINRDAGWVGTWKGIATWYGASLAIAGTIVGLPIAGQLLNEFLLGSAEDRVFYESWTLTRGRIAAYIADNGGRIISETRLGGWIEEAVGINDTFASKLAWRYASRLWAIGAGGSITAVVSSTPNWESYLFTEELPRILENAKAFLPIRFYL